MTAPDNSNPTVAVVTLHNSPNYGSCLQTYATQKVLASVGASPTIVDYYRADAIPANETDRALTVRWPRKCPFLRFLALRRWHVSR